MKHPHNRLLGQCLKRLELLPFLVKEKTLEPIGSLDEVISGRVTNVTFRTPKDNNGNEIESGKYYKYLGGENKELNPLEGLSEGLRQQAVVEVENVDNEAGRVEVVQSRIHRFVYLWFDLIEGCEKVDKAASGDKSHPHAELIRMVLNHEPLLRFIVNANKTGTRISLHDLVDSGEETIYQTIKPTDSHHNPFQEGRCYRFNKHNSQCLEYNDRFELISLCDDGTACVEDHVRGYTTVLWYDELEECEPC